jgi:hypothetical protein
LNLDQANDIKTYCQAQHLPLIGALPHDRVFTEAMVRGLTVTEFRPQGIGAAVEAVWHTILGLGAESAPARDHAAIA